MSTATEKPNEGMAKLIAAAIQKNLKTELDREIQEAVKRVEARRDEIVTATVLDIVGMADMQNFSDRLVITLKKQ